LNQPFLIFILQFGLTLNLRFRHTHHLLRHLVGFLLAPIVRLVDGQFGLKRFLLFFLFRFDLAVQARPRHTHHPTPYPIYFLLVPIIRLADSEFGLEQGRL
jgi:hypothetical protein